MNNQSYYHKELAEGRWFQFSLAQQLGNTGSEINRAINHFEKNNIEAGLNAFYRGLELLDLTISDPRLRRRLKEIVRLREILCDRFLGDNIYNTSFDFLKNIFISLVIWQEIRLGKGNP